MRAHRRPGRAVGKSSTLRRFSRAWSRFRPAVIAMSRTGQGLFFPLPLPLPPFPLPLPPFPLPLPPFPLPFPFALPLPVLVPLALALALPFPLPPAFAFAFPPPFPLLPAASAALAAPPAAEDPPLPMPAPDAVAPLLLALPTEPPPAPDWLSGALQIVASLPGVRPLLLLFAALVPCASPCVTLWKLSFTSPIGAAIRTAPLRGPRAMLASWLADFALPCTAARCAPAWFARPRSRFCGARMPDFGTLICSRVGTRGAPRSIGLNTPVPVSDSPCTPCAKDCAACPGRTCPICPVLKSTTSTWPRCTSTRVPVGVTDTRNCVPFTTAAR